MTGYGGKRSIWIIWLIFQFVGLTYLAVGQELLLESAKQDYFNGEFSDLNAKLETLLKDYPEQPSVNILRGLTLLHGGKIEDILQGKVLIEKNAHRQPDDAFSNYALGILYKEQDIRRSARKYFLKALENDDEMVEALVELGLDYSHEVRRYYNRYTDTEIALSYRSFALDDYDFAVSYLRKALRLDPDNRDAAYVLGGLYYELEEYNLMATLFQEMKAYFPDDRDVNLFLGLVNLAKRQYREACQSFMTALDKMSVEENQQLLNPEYLVKNSKELNSTEQISAFWTAKDPMFLTAENERILEHYGRFAYANLAFSVPKLKIEGWKTDRGKTYIRYGRPLTVVEYGRSMEFSAIYPPMQIWIYPQFQLAFSDEFWNGLYQFTEPSLNPRSTFKERTFVNYTLVAENIFASLPDRFDFNLAGGNFFAPYQMNFFKEQKQTIGYLTFAIPVEDIIYHSVQKISAGLFILNDDKVPVNQFLVDFEGDMNNLSFYSEENYLVRNFSFYPDSVNLSYSFEILNHSLNKNFVDRREVTTPTYNDTTLLTSDLVLASKIIPVGQPEQLVRNNLTIYPNFHHIFEDSDTLVAYFEIYNLSKNVDGQVHYTVESSLTKEENGGLWGSLFSKKKRISVVNEYSGTNTSDFVIQSVDIKNLESGKYEFEIIVKDEVQKTTVEQKTELDIISRLNN